MATQTQQSSSGAGTDIRRLLMIALIGIAFFTSYSYATAKTRGPVDDAYSLGAGGGGCCGGGGAPGAAAPGAGDPGAAAPGGGGCCGGSSEPIEAETVVEGDIQRIAVDASNGYDPNIIYAAAGVPMEITFGQGFGCFAEVYFPDFNIFEDLTAGPKTITLPALEPGVYEWSCGMQMVFGTIVVE